VETGERRGAPLMAFVVATCGSAIRGGDAMVRAARTRREDEHVKEGGPAAVFRLTSTGARAARRRCCCSTVRRLGGAWNACCAHAAREQAGRAGHPRRAARPCGACAQAWASVGMWCLCASVGRKWKKKRRKREREIRGGDRGRTHTRAGRA
jgi:hypothetical protein